jgi:hypothetical protein
VLRKQFLFFCTADCTNNNYHFQIILAFTAIFLIHQSIHFSGASTAGHGRLSFSEAKQVHIHKKPGNVHNVRICNGKPFQKLAKKFGVLAVLCSRNNGNHVTPIPPVSNFDFTVILTIPRNPTNGNPIPNGGIENLVEITSLGDPNVTVSQTESSTTVSVGSVDGNTAMDFLLTL